MDSDKKSEKVRNWALVVLHSLLICYFIADFFIFLPKQDWTNLDILGGAFIFLGLAQIFISFYYMGRNLTPYPEPKKTGRLVTMGIYKRARHPIYGGVVIATFGELIYHINFFAAILWGVLFIMLMAKSEIEESYLLKRFKEYKDYVKNVNRFFPF